MIQLYRILFVCLALLGVFILFKVIPVITKIVTEKPVMSLPLTQESGMFEVPTAGDYSIWQKGNGSRRTRIEMGMPVVIQASSGLIIPLRRTGGMITANDGSGTRRQLYTFSVPVQGAYRIELPPDAAAARNNSSSFSLEIRKPMPVVRLVLGILAIILGFALVVGGIVGTRVV